MVFHHQLQRSSSDVYPKVRLSCLASTYLSGSIDICCGDDPTEKKSGRMSTRGLQCALRGVRGQRNTCYFDIERHTSGSHKPSIPSRRGFAVRPATIRHFSDLCSYTQAGLLLLGKYLENSKLKNPKEASLSTPCQMSSHPNKANRNGMFGIKAQDPKRKFRSPAITGGNTGRR